MEEGTGSESQQAPNPRISGVGSVPAPSFGLSHTHLEFIERQTRLIDRFGRRTTNLNRPDVSYVMEEGQTN